MNKILVFIVALVSIQVYSQELFSIKNGIVIPAKEYSLWHFEDRDESIHEYQQIDSTTISARNGYSYDIRVFQHVKDDPDKEMLDTVFSKLEIVPRSPIVLLEAPNVLNKISFVNQGGWLRFNYWSFDPYSDNPRREIGDESFRYYHLSDDCIALVLRGWRDSVSPADLTLIVLYKNEAKLVYFVQKEITTVSTEGDLVTIGLDTPVHDENEEDMISKIAHSKLILGNGTIILNDNYSVTDL
jgi:hypothetical protein